MARPKKKIEEVIEKKEEVITSSSKRKSKKKEEIITQVEEIVIPKKRTRKTEKNIETNTKEQKEIEVKIESAKDNIKEKPKRTRKSKEVTVEVIEEPKSSKQPKKKKEEYKPVVIVNETSKKRLKKNDDVPKLSSTPPPPIIKEESKSKVQKTPDSKKSKRSSVNIKDYYDFGEGKYVLGDVDELFDEKLAKKIKTTLKKLSKKNHGKDEKLGIHFFKVGDKVWDLIDYNNKILTVNSSLILCKSEIVTKEGKLRFCRRFEAKGNFRLYVDYTNNDYCLYFLNEDDPSPFIMLQNEAPI